MVIVESFVIQVIGLLVISIMWKLSRIKKSARSSRRVSTPDERTRLIDANDDDGINIKDDNNNRNADHRSTQQTVQN